MAIGICFLVLAYILPLPPLLPPFFLIWHCTMMFLLNEQESVRQIHRPNECKGEDFSSERQYTCNETYL